VWVIFSTVFVGISEAKWYLSCSKVSGQSHRPKRSWSPLRSLNTLTFSLSLFCKYTHSHSLSPSHYLLQTHTHTYTHTNFFSLSCKHIRTHTYTNTISLSHYLSLTLIHTRTHLFSLWKPWLMRRAQTLICWDWPDESNCRWWYPRRWRTKREREIVCVWACAWMRERVPYS